MCLVRGFIAGWVRLLREYNGMVKEYGKDGWESVMRFGDKIEMLDDGRSTAEVEWSDCRKLEDQGALAVPGIPGRPGISLSAQV